MFWLLALLAVLAAVALLFLGVLVWQAGRKPVGNPQYVALGSSFAAGIGLGPRVPGSPFVCMRSSNGYPQQLARLRSLSLVDMSCSGATAAHVLRGGQVFLGPQLDGLSPETELVTITAGGNDINYVGDLVFMAGAKSPSLLGRTMRLVAREPFPAASRDYAGVKQNLLAILSEIRRRSPRARVVVVSYPVILPAEGSCAKIVIDDADAAMMRDVGERLVAVTRDAAVQGGAVFVDMQRLGAGRDACAPDPWVNGWADAVGTQFHPTLAGAKAIADAVAEALDTPIALRDALR